MWAPLATLSWEARRVWWAFLVPRVRFTPKACCPENTPKGAHRAEIPSLDLHAVGIIGAGSIIAYPPRFVRQKIPALGPIQPKVTKIPDLPLFGPE